MMPLLRRQATGPSSFIAQEEEVPSSSSLSSLPVDSKGREIRKCPRCDSLNTKFCYYNNHRLSQPRHFCKSCRRFWTHGGFLHDVPIGGARRRTNSSSSSNNNRNINSNRNNNNKKRKRRSLSSLLPKIPLLQNETKPLQNGTEEEPTKSGENLEGVKNFPTEAASFFPNITTDGEDDELIGSSSTTGFMDLLLSGGVDPKEVFSFGSFSQLLNPSSDSAEIMAAQMVGGCAKAWNAF